MSDITILPISAREKMDRSWIQLKDRLHADYRDGVKKFLEFAFAHIEPGSKILCPCVKCNNCYRKNREEVDAHLLVYGIVKSYTRWVHHGEKFENDSGEDDDNDNGIGDQHNEEDVEDYEMQQMINDIATGIFGDTWQGFDSIAEGCDDSTTEGPHHVHEREETFVELLKEARQQLHPGSDFSKLSFLVKLLHIKVMSNWSNKSFNLFLELWKQVFPNMLPGSYDEAKKIIKGLGLGYIKIHACEFDCALFWKEYKDLDSCPKCHTSRWNFEGSKKIPKKVLRYFPLKPTLQRLFMNKDIAEDMRWHKEKRIDERNVSRHPADSPLWKEFDEIHKSFADDSRNIRLGIASDGFNPFGHMSSAYSVWPVIVTPYNFPPWRCMKDPFLFMSLLIPGPKSPSSDIHVFLQPLIDDLDELWNVGIKTYDAFSKQYFQLRAIMTWTMNDLPAYAMLSGWSTKGRLACPVCMGETSSCWLANWKKHCYMGHRRFLPMDHKWRDMEDEFDGHKDFRDKIKVLSGDEILAQLASIQPMEHGKHPGKKKRKRADTDLNWTTKSIFYKLSYVKDLKIRFMLDPMHIQKAICDSLLGTFFNIEGKTKDNWKARKDLEIQGIRQELHMRYDGDSFVLPPACYNLSRDEKRRICEFLTSVKFPDNFASNILRYVNTKECRISGMKSHDCHVFLHRLLPLAIRGVLRKDLCQAIFELCNYFQEVCSKTLHLDELERLESQIPITLCKLEQIFPPSFFDVMVHLTIHLAYEAKIAGPVQYRWMFPIERYYIYIFALLIYEKLEHIN